MECLSYCLGNKIDLSRLDAHFKMPNSGWTSLRSREVIRIHPINTPEHMLYIFKNGTIVSWGIKRHQMTGYLETIHPFVDKPTRFKLFDTFSYRSSNKTAIAPHRYFDVDCIELEEDSDDLKLAFSYGLSQSVKLQYFETSIDTLIEKYSSIIHRLSTTGVMEMSRKEIRQAIGEILGAKSEMNLISNFLYHPKFFWQHPTLEGHYTMLERYLHIERRINALNHRIDTLNEIFEMLNSTLENRHASILEIIIIILITIEIIFGVMNFHF